MKLTQQEKLIEAAKLDGWTTKLPPNHIRYYPAYDKSYDAIITVIQKQPEEVRSMIARSGPDGRLSFMSTPAQLLDALLAAKGFEV